MISGRSPLGKMPLEMPDMARDLRSVSGGVNVDCDSEIWTLKSRVNAARVTVKRWVVEHQRRHLTAYGRRFFGRSFRPPCLPSNNATAATRCPATLCCTIDTTY